MNSHINNISLLILSLQQCHIIIVGETGIVDSAKILGLPVATEVGTKIGAKGKTGVTATRIFMNLLNKIGKLFERRVLPAQTILGQYRILETVLPSVDHKFVINRNRASGELIYTKQKNKWDIQMDGESVTGDGRSCGNTFARTLEW